MEVGWSRRLEVGCDRRGVSQQCSPVRSSASTQARRCGAGAPPLPAVLGEHTPGAARRAGGRAGLGAIGVRRGGHRRHDAGKPHAAVRARPSARTPGGPQAEAARQRGRAYPAARRPPLSAAARARRRHGTAARGERARRRDGAEARHGAGAARHGRAGGPQLLVMEDAQTPATWSTALTTRSSSSDENLPTDEFVLRYVKKKQEGLWYEVKLITLVHHRRQGQTAELRLDRFDVDYGFFSSPMDPVVLCLGSAGTYSWRFFGNDPGAYVFFCYTNMHMNQKKQRHALTARGRNWASTGKCLKKLMNGSIKPIRSLIVQHTVDLHRDSSSSDGVSSEEPPIVLRALNRIEAPEFPGVSCHNDDLSILRSTRVPRRSSTCQSRWLCHVDGYSG